MMSFKAILLIVYLTQCTGFLTDSTNDLKEIKTSTSTIIGYLQNWNNLYLNQVEPKLSNSNIKIANIDNNVKNLQGRAHVWDTFQLHVTAWNEQLASTDRKIDILLNGQESGFNSLDIQLSTLNHFDYKIDTLLKNITKLENVTNYQKDLVKNSNEMLSELKQFDKKLSNYYSKSDATKCSTTSKVSMPKLEGIVHDISSKVDVIFDAIANDKKSNYVDEEYMDDQEIVEDADENESDFDVKLFKLILARINRPCRQTNNMLKTLTNKLQTVQENINRLDFAMHKNTANEQSSFTEQSCLNLQSCLNVESLLFKFVEDVKSEIYKNFNTFNDVIKDHFTTQQVYIEDALKYVGNAKSVDDFNEELSVISTNKSSCEELDNSHKSGVYKFLTKNTTTGENYFIRYCEFRGDVKWTVIQRRGVRTNQNFHMNWQQYKEGFGNLNGDFWFGNEFIHLLTSNKNMILHVELESFDGQLAWAEYETFVVATEDEKYKLTVGNYKGNATDSFTSHNNSLFSTYDRKNDDAPECCPCSISYGGGWWFNSCFESNLNGNYYKYPLKSNYQGLIWESWLGNVSLKKTKMMIRNPRDPRKDLVLNKGVDITANSVNVANVTEIPYYEDP